MLTVAAIEWLIPPGATPVRVMTFTVATVLILGQGLLFQRRYHQQAPSLWYVFDARFSRKVLAPALAAGPRPVYLLDEPGKAGYIHPLWYGALARLDSATFARLSWGNSPPPGAVVLSTEEICQNCRVIARALNYTVYSVPPHSIEANVRKEPLSEFRADIVCEDSAPVMVAGETKSFRFLIKNISTAEWPCVGDANNNYSVRLQSRWIGPDSDKVTRDEVEQRLPYDVEPGDTVGLTLSIRAPSEPGSYYLEVDLVQKQIARFAERGSTPVRTAIKIVPRQP